MISENIPEITQAVLSQKIIKNSIKHNFEACSNSEILYPYQKDMTIFLFYVNAW